MNPILIQGAENSEINYFLQKMKNKKEIEIATFKFWTGELFDYPIIISRIKVGEVNSAIATTIAIMNFKPNFIINQGTAGAHAIDLHRGDIVIGEDYFNISSFLIEPREHGKGSDINGWKLKKYISDDDLEISNKADENMVNIAKKCVKEYKKGKVIFGKIGSGDIWDREIDRIDWLHNTYGTLCEEMEIAGSYNSANSFGVPVLGIRIISNNEILGEEYKPEISTDCQEFVEIFVRKIIKEILD